MFEGLISYQKLYNIVLNYNITTRLFNIVLFDDSNKQNNKSAENIPADLLESELLKILEFLNSLETKAEIFDDFLNSTLLD